MSSRLHLAIFLVPVIIIVLVLVAAVQLFGNRSGEADQPVVGLTASAILESPTGDYMGSVKFRQASTGVLIMAEVAGLPPGGHAFIIHETGSCAPDFAAAGDHFNPSQTEHGFVHPSWKRGEPAGAHGGDLPNIYAAADGSARADFFSQGITLDTTLLHTILDADGSAIIVHEFPDAYGDQESNTGRRLACGVIDRT